MSMTSSSVEQEKMQHKSLNLPMEHPGTKLDQSWFARPADQVAHDLIGCVLKRTLSDGTVLAGTISETEAYIGPEDRASHGYNNRRTARNESMWSDPATIYVYMVYGMHFCFNVSCLRSHHPAAVLIRAIQPIHGIEIMRKNRLSTATSKARKTQLKDPQLCNGPAKLCQALQINRDLDSENLLQSTQVAIHHGDAIGQEDILNTPRIGIGYAQDWRDKPLRWVRILHP
jgi:DNA-3-methyladenine glycosylase